jgi:hypothetical protein
MIITANAPSHARGAEHAVHDSRITIRHAREAAVEGAKESGRVRLVRFLSSIAQSAGVSVSATMPESTTAITMVMANWRNSSPVTPPVKPTGTNTAQSTSTIAMSAPRTCRIARSAATRADTFSTAMMRSTFSITTIASSTTMPIASTSANSVSTLMEKPSTRRPRNVPITETGTASMGIRVARKLCRKRNTTNATRIIAMISVSVTSSIDAVTKGVVSNGTL